MTKPPNWNSSDPASLQEAIERKADELRALGLTEEEVKRATDPLRSFYLHDEPTRDDSSRK